MACCFPEKRIGLLALFGVEAFTDVVREVQITLPASRKDGWSLERTCSGEKG